MNKKLIIIGVIVVLLISVIGIAVFSLEDEEPELEFEPESISIPEPEPEPEQAVSELETPASTFAPAPQAEAAAAAVAPAAAPAAASRKCKSNAQCNKGWWCQNGTCVEGCHSNTDPRNPATGKCLWNNGNIPIGQQCNRNIHSDCVSNHCLNNHCVAPKKRYILPKYSIDTCAYVLDVIFLQPNLINYIKTSPAGLFYRFENQDKDLGLIKKDNNNNAVIWYPRKGDTFPHPHGCATGTPPGCITAVCKRQLPSLEIGKTFNNPLILPDTVPDSCSIILNYVLVRPHLVHIIKTNNAGLFYKFKRHNKPHGVIKKDNNNNAVIWYPRNGDTFPHPHGCASGTVPSCRTAVCVRQLPNCTLTSTQDGSLQKPIVLNVPWMIADVFKKVFSTYLNKFTSTNNCIYCKYKATDGMLLRIVKISNNKYSCSEMNGAQRTWIKEYK